MNLQNLKQKNGNVVIKNVFSNTGIFTVPCKCTDYHSTILFAIGHAVFGVQLLKNGTCETKNNNITATLENDILTVNTNNEVPWYTGGFCIMREENVQ